MISNMNLFKNENFKRFFKDFISGSNHYSIIKKKEIKFGDFLEWYWK